MFRRRCNREAVTLRRYGEWMGGHGPVWFSRGAAEWNSLGRQPQVLWRRRIVAPEGRNLRAPATRVAPPGLLRSFRFRFLGLTPQAIACRRSAASPRQISRRMLLQEMKMG